MSLPAPDKSKLPPLPQRNVDPMNSIAKMVALVFFLPLPLILVFGAKAFLWIGIATVVVAIFRYVNMPLPAPSGPSAEPVATALRTAPQPTANSVKPSSIVK